MTGVEFGLVLGRVVLGVLLVRGFGLVELLVVP